MCTTYSSNISTTAIMNPGNHLLQTLTLPPSPPYFPIFPSNLPHPPTPATINSSTAYPSAFPSPHHPPNPLSRAPPPPNRGWERGRRDGWGCEEGRGAGGVVVLHWLEVVRQICCLICAYICLPLVMHVGYMDVLVVIVYHVSCLYLPSFSMANRYASAAPRSILVWNTSMRASRTACGIFPDDPHI